MLFLAGAAPSGSGPRGPVQPSEKSTAKVSDESPFDAGHYDQMPVDESFKAKTVRDEVIRTLHGEGSGPGGQQLLKDYYTKYALACWTLPTNLTNLPTLRKGLLDDLAKATGDGVAARLNELALSTLRGMARGNYHPSVRYNAMLAIGSLSTPATGAGGRGTPYAAALPVMLEAVRSAEQSDVVKVAALIGITRHVASGAVESQVREQEIVPTMLTLATTKVSPGRSSDGHAWIRGKALEVLGEAGSLGPQQNVITALVEIAGDSDTPFMTRCAAARALGQLLYPANVTMSPSELVAQVGSLAAEGLAYELDQKAPDFEAMLQFRRSGATQPQTPMAAPTIFGDDGGDDKDDDRRGRGTGGAPSPQAINVDRSQLESEVALQVRRRLGERVEATRRALVGSKDGERTGLGTLAKQPAQKSYVDDVVKRLEITMALCEDERVTYEDLMKRIRTDLTGLRTALDAAPAAAAGEGAAKANAKADGKEKSKEKPAPKAPKAP